MRHPRDWRWWTVWLVVLLIAGQYAMLTWIAPRHVLRLAQRLLGGALLIDRARLALPLTTRFSGIRFVHNSAQSAFTIQQAVIRPRLLLPSLKMISLASIELDRPFLRITRTRTGTTVWPVLSHADGHGAAGAWQLRADTVRVTDGTIEWIDETVEPPFHAVFDRMSFVVGPVTWPGGGEQTSFAVRGAILGRAEDPAPVYCSGWWALTAGDLQASCQLEPLPLALFDPYFQGPPTIRVYGATISSTSQWTARANALEARIQLELGHLDEGDLSVHGRTIVDVKRLATADDPTIKGEVMLTGTLDSPEQWSGDFIPGNQGAQRLAAQFLERNVKALKVALGPKRVGVRIGAGSEAAAQDIEAAAQGIREALEMLTTPVVYDVSIATQPPLVSPRAPWVPTPDSEFMLDL